MVTATRTYLVECYTPGVEQHTIEATARRARVAAVGLQAEGHNIQYVNAVLVPDDEVVFHVFASDDPEAVREASVRAEVPFERIVESVAVGEPTTPALAHDLGTRM